MVVARHLGDVLRVAYDDILAADHNGEIVVSEMAESVLHHHHHLIGYYHPQVTTDPARRRNSLDYQNMITNEEWAGAMTLSKLSCSALFNFGAAIFVGIF